MEDDTILWLIVIGGGVYILYKSGVFKIFKAAGNVAEAAGNVAEAAGNAAESSSDVFSNYTPNLFDILGGSPSYEKPSGNLGADFLKSLRRLNPFRKVEKIPRSSGGSSSSSLKKFIETQKSIEDAKEKSLRVKKLLKITPEQEKGGQFLDLISKSKSKSLKGGGSSSSGSFSYGGITFNKEGYPINESEKKKLKRLYPKIRV